MGLWTTADENAEIAIHHDAQSRSVEMWTTRRLPLDPNGALREAKKQIKKYLGQLIAAPDESLVATYTSDNSDFVDTENVLLYNVGQSCFSRCSRTGIVFTRNFDAPPSSPDERSHWTHYHRYEVNSSKVSCAKKQSEKAILNFKMSQLSSSLKQHHYWWAAKQGNLEVGSCAEFGNAPYRLRVVITGRSLRANLTSVIKSLFDGVISSLHYDPSVNWENEASRRLAKSFQVNNEHVAQFLRDESWGLLGLRKLVSRP